MKEFYENILSRNPEEPSPLEKVILWECAQAETLDPLQDQRITRMLEDIRQRKAEADAFDGCDWVVSTLEGLLNRALKYGDPMPREELLALPPQEQRLRRTAQRNRPAAEAYQLYQQGQPCLNKDAKRRLLRLYESIVGRLETPSGSGISHVQTLRTLMDTPHRGFRQDCTGRIRYRYYDQDRLLGTAVTQILPDFPTTIHCGGLSFCSSFDPQITVFPGMYRNILDADDPTRLAARLTWITWGQHELEIHGDANSRIIRIRKEDDRYVFYTEGRCIAETVTLPEKQRLMDWELHVLMTFHEDLSHETKVLLMSFPTLCIGP